MKYYKITNQKENHNNLQYHDGLVKDHLPFNPTGDCTAGGIYFASTDILAFLSYGPWIREITIPEGEKIYENPGEPKKYKAHRVILSPRKKITLKVIKELVSQGADVHADDDYAIRWAVRNGHLEIVKYLVSVGADVHADDDYAICWAAENGHLEIVKYLVSQGADVHADDDYAICWAAENGHFEMVKYLVSVGADVHADNDYAVRWSVRNGHLEIVKYLKSLG